VVIEQEGKQIKFIKEVEQVTFSGRYANKNNQPVLYITERCVFELKEDGLHLIEVAPGIDIQTQILDLMEFAPKIDGEIKIMDERLFREENMGLKK
ncbi:MAG: 3-oxoacid CoA-transferase, partial [Clostridiaceae bacterium]